MIIEAIINGFFSIISFVFGLFTLPAFPLVMANSITNVLHYLAVPIGIMRTFLGDTYITALIGALIAYWLLHPIIHGTLFIWGHIRGSGKN